MTIPKIETDEQFFALHLAFRLTYPISKRENWPLTGEYPGGWGQVIESFSKAESEWKANNKYRPEGAEHSVFGRYKLLENREAADWQALLGLADRFSGTMTEDEIFAAAQTIVQGWLAKESI